MSIVCLKCRLGNKPGKNQKGPTGGKSRVVETRTIPNRTRLYGKRVRTHTVRRIRECIGCRRRWTTIEITLFASYKGFGNGPH